MKKEIKIKRTLDQKTLAGLLEDLVATFKAGTICLESGGEFVTLKPGRHIEVEIEAGHKKEKQKLTLSLNWRTDAPEEKPVVDLKISSTEPEMAAPVEDAEDEKSSDSGEDAED